MTMVGTCHKGGYKTRGGGGGGEGGCLSHAKGGGGAQQVLRKVKHGSLKFFLAILKEGAKSVHSLEKVVVGK